MTHSRALATYAYNRIHKYHVEQEIEADWTKEQKIRYKPPQLIMIEDEIRIEV